MKQWKSVVFSHAKKENSIRNLTVIGNPQKTLGNKRFQQPGRRVPGREAMRPPAARPGITMPYHGNQCKIIGFCMSGQMQYGAVRWVPLRSMGNLTVIGKPLKTIGNMVSRPCQSKIKNNPPTVTFPGKERSQNLTFGNQWKTFENHWENMLCLPCRPRMAEC